MAGLGAFSGSSCILDEFCSTFFWVSSCCSFGSDKFCDSDGFGVSDELEDSCVFRVEDSCGFCLLEPGWKLAGGLTSELFDLLGWVVGEFLTKNDCLFDLAKFFLVIFLFFFLLIFFFFF